MHHAQQLVKHAAALHHQGRHQAGLGIGVHQLAQDARLALGHGGAHTLALAIRSEAARSRALNQRLTM